jgi:hypothetical protein
MTSSSERDRLSREIAGSVPVVRLFVAACMMMRRQRTDLPADAAIEPSKDDVIEFIERLDVRGLRELRRVARKLEGGAVH